MFEQVVTASATIRVRGFDSPSHASTVARSWAPTARRCARLCAELYPMRIAVVESPANHV
jgi:hypothetical protein